jgi:hypothetical protein
MDGRAFTRSIDLFSQTFLRACGLTVWIVDGVELARSPLVGNSNALLTSDPQAVDAFVNAPTIGQLVPPVAPSSAATFEATTERDVASPPPSRRDLLERAAALGPARMTWESFVLPNDPILKSKMLPHVAERRARFRRVVQLAVGASAACCLVALVVSVVSSGDNPVASSGKNAPAAAVVPIEKLDVVARTKALGGAKIAHSSAAVSHASKLGKRR